jgi:hypothetical protein
MTTLRTATAGLAALIFVCGILVAKAQDTDKSHAKTRSITGCLQNGDNSHEYKLIAKSGGRWDLKSDSVNMSEHVGHMVKVTGVVSNATAHNMKEDIKQGVDKDSNETGDMTVTNMTMVSTSCPK